jgi:hypothetical protein
LYKDNINFGGEHEVLDTQLDEEARSADKTGYS